MGANCDTFSRKIYNNYVSVTAYKRLVVLDNWQIDCLLKKIDSCWEHRG